MNFLNILLIAVISTLIVFASAADENDNGSLSCTYMDGWMTDYFCILEIDNPNSLDNFDRIDGEHTSIGYNSSNVDTVYGMAAREGTATNIPSIICASFENLKDLWLDHLTIAAVSDKAFADCANLESVYLGYNAIVDVTENAFVNNLKLRLLDLGNNQLSSLPHDVFGSLADLQHLFLDGNHFKSLQMQWFAPLNGLVEIKLAKNEIFELQSGLFAIINNLERLDVSNNHLTAINSLAFGDLSSLTHLNAAYNKISAVDAKFFNAASQLESLHLEKNLCIDENYETFNGFNLNDLAMCFDNFEEAELKCTFMPGYLTSYLCLLDIKNPHGRDDFGPIEGTHRGKIYYFFNTLCLSLN